MKSSLFVRPSRRVWLLLAIVPIASFPMIASAQFSRSDFGKASQFNVAPSAPSPTPAPSYTPPSYTPPSFQGGGSPGYQQPSPAPSPPQPSPREIARQKRMQESYDENNAGVAASKKGNERTALKHYRNAVELNPGDKVLRENYNYALAIVDTQTAKEMFERGDFNDAIAQCRAALALFKEYLSHHPGDKITQGNIAGMEQEIRDAQGRIQSQKWDEEYKLKEAQEEREKDAKLAAVKGDVVDVLEQLRVNLSADKTSSSSKEGGNGALAQLKDMAGAGLDFDGRQNSGTTGTGLDFLPASGTPSDIGGSPVASSGPAVPPPGGDASVVDLRDKRSLTVGIASVKGEPGASASSLSPAGSQPLEFMSAKSAPSPSAVVDISAIVPEFSNPAEWRARVDDALGTTASAAAANDKGKTLAALTQTANLMAGEPGAARQEKRMAYQQLAEAAGLKPDDFLVNSDVSLTREQMRDAYKQLALAAGLKTDDSTLHRFDPQPGDNQRLLEFMEPLVASSKKTQEEPPSPSVQTFKMMEELRSHDPRKIGVIDSRDDAAFGETIRRLKADPQLAPRLRSIQKLSLAKDQIRLQLAYDERNANLAKVREVLEHIQKKEDLSKGSTAYLKTNAEQFLKGINEDWRAASSGALRLGYDELKRDVDELAKELPPVETASGKSPADTRVLAK